MRRGIWGATVGTSVSEDKIREVAGNTGGGGKITINGEGPDKNGNFIINTLNDVEIAQLDATLIGGIK